MTVPERAADRVRVDIAEFVVADDGETLRCTGLGSCLAVALYDPESGVGGLAHVMLPHGEEEGDRKPGKYADTAIRAMLKEMISHGASYTDAEAKLAGGSDIFGFENFGAGIGEENVAAARAELENLDVPVVGEAVGGDHGRTVTFDTATGTLYVSAADREDRREL